MNRVNVSLKDNNWACNSNKSHGELENPTGMRTRWKEVSKVIEPLKS